MSTKHTSLTRRALSSIKRFWSEADYAERRLFELRTGVPIEPRSRLR